MPSNKKLLQAAAGNAGESLYVEDVFSTYLYTGNNSSQTITNNIDLAGEGGLVWFKRRSTARTHILIDTERGKTSYLQSNETVAAETGITNTITSFNSDGFSISDQQDINGNAETVASFTFRKAEKFFDVVGPFTGNGNSSHLISHNLGSTPAFMIMKRTDSTSGWMTAASDGAGNYKAAFNLNSTAQSYVTTPISTVSTDSTVDVGYWNPNWDGAANLSGATYVLYLFASDAGGFGDDGDESIIKCGSYTGTGSAGLEVDLGFEPQWVLVKSTTSSSGNWLLMDVMRGMHNTGGAALFPNQSYAESNLSAYTSGYIVPTSTGFVINAVNNVNVNQNSGNYIYIAIRRPMKTPESGTEVFNPTTAAVGTDITNNFAADLWFGNNTSGDGGNNAHTFASRLTGLKWLQTATTSAESTASNTFYWDSNTEFTNNQFGGSRVEYFLKRATGFMDVVATTGASGVLTLNHNLGVPPEFLISKRRNGTSHWYADQVVNYLRLNTDGGNLGTPVFNNFTATTFNADAGTFSSGETYITYLFATLAGVSKVGSYTGTNTTNNIDCGFSSSARFILIKRTDSTGDWYFWDSARGIVAGNDPYLLLNTTAVEVTNTDYVDPLSSGFTVTSSAPAALNASGGTYIFLAIS